MDSKRSWKRILKVAEIKDLRIHDLRRTLDSYQESLGANSYIIGKLICNLKIRIKVDSNIF